MSDSAEPLQIGEVIVPRNTPKGPEKARIAWADALNTLLTVVAATGRGEAAVTKGYRQPCFRVGVFVDTYERPDGRPFRGGPDA